MLKHNYTITKSDYLNYNILHLKRNKDVNRARIMQQTAVPVVFLILAFLTYKIFNRPILNTVVPFTALAALWIIFYPRFFMSSTLKQIKRIIESPESNTYEGEISLIADEDGLTEISTKGKTVTPWKDILDIELTDEYLFIYNSLVSAYIIPRRSFEYEEVRTEFMDYLEEMRKINKLESEQKAPAIHEPLDANDDADDMFEGDGGDGG